MMTKPISAAALAVLTLLAAGPRAECAVTPSGPVRFTNVKGWQGTYTVTATSSGSSTFAGIKDSWTIDETDQGSFHLDDSGASLKTWSGEISGGATVNHKLVSIVKNCTSTHTFHYQGVAKGSVFVQLDVLSGNYKIFIGGAPLDVVHEIEDCNGGKTKLNWPAVWGPSGPEITMALPASGYELSGNQSIPGYAGMLPSLVLQSNPFLGSFEYEVSWKLTPTEINQPELVVDPAGYDTWRPKAGANERTPGNTITIQAKYQNKDGSTPTEKPVKITFELLDTSGEPGICMNYPPKAQATDDYDLQFDPRNNKRFKISDDGQQADTLDPEPTEASVTLTSYDWGGWTTLKVTAELEDGTKVTGYLKSDRSQEKIRLPKRSSKSFIPDSWKKDQGVEDQPDDSDEDDKPQGDGHKGDGFTLYEEYRGFYENGVHVEGNPAQKEYFFRDEIGDRTLIGIAIFRSVTGFLVRDKLRADEFPKDRVMNGNHSEGAHVVDQHGVIIKNQALPDGWIAVAYSDPIVDPGPPKSTEVIYIADNKPIEFKANVVRGAFDRVDGAVAHEMLHTTSVFHHGQADGAEAWILVLPGDENVPTDRPRILHAGEYAGGWIDVFAEDGADIVNRWLPKVLHLPFYGDLFGNFDKKLSLGIQTIGAQHGQNSGVEECLMRYGTATAYRKLNQQGAYYVIDSQTSGIALCTQKTGTGGNDPNHPPQSRHGDADKGDCTHQLCVNDRYH
jgi:hypothetical protein